MTVIIVPQRGSYRLIIYNGKKVLDTGVFGLTSTAKGYRPVDFKTRKPGRRNYQKVATKQLVDLIRTSSIWITNPDPALMAFLGDFQVSSKVAPLCRTCLLEDRVTVLNKKNGVKYGRERVCMDCAERELRREMGYLGQFGHRSFQHIRALLETYKDVDRVLGLLQPEQRDPSQTLFDRMEAVKPIKTRHITQVPVPPAFAKASGVEYLTPVQQLAVNGGLLEGKDLLVVSATASGKTFVGEMAGMKNLLEKGGRMLFLVPLVALANQKYFRFRERYKDLATVSLQTGTSRLNLPETRPVGERNMRAQIIVGTYEGVDTIFRNGRELKGVGTVVIDEVQNLEEPERGHRLDGLIARIKKTSPNAQFLYLSATIGAPNVLAKKLNAKLVRYDSRPVPLDRHLIFCERKKKVQFIKSMVREEFARRSSKGYQGQTIVFTNARARCHTLADAIGANVARPYHSGLTAKERRHVEELFGSQKIACVVTTAALAAGVDFPASQVVFDSLAMGIKWLTVQEFNQMLGRAGRPDFHDQGRIVLLAEPGGTYSRTSKVTEEEMAIALLKGEMEEVAPVYDIEGSSEEFAANAIVCKGDEAEVRWMEQQMVGTTEPVLETLQKHRLVRRKQGHIELSDLAGVMARHFIGVERLLLVRHLVRESDDPLEIVAEIDCTEARKEEA
ncbi:DEAD/DEAH box helicase [Methanofollis formosanus]|uniref:DEAD/DEAH box helicase n=1 Tax=Methanofollis formosanus TaxID=299308 RepID=A0A8G1A1Y4_9EURY|nr:DEAD/DEAH box helicase [Methanofollis formosanus]QYZ78933.1 DEAD/DEAH box helicase [Methanofollis formosanus]